MSDSVLNDLLARSTVRLTLTSSSDAATGFYVAPGLVLTCAM